MVDSGTGIEKMVTAFLFLFGLFLRVTFLLVVLFLCCFQYLASVPTGEEISFLLFNFFFNFTKSFQSVDVSFFFHLIYCFSNSPVLILARF